MSEWKGQSRGTVLGYKIFVFVIQNFGLKTAYALVRAVMVYFVIFGGTATKSGFVFFRKRMGYSRLKSIFNVHKSFCLLGQTMVDRFAISSGKSEKFTFEFEGREHIENLVKANKGGLLFTAHLGNINVAEYFFEETGAEINMVVTDLEHLEIKEYIASVTRSSNIKFIVAQEDMSHIFQINKALENKELIVFAADRQLKKRKHFTTGFMEKPTEFFYGPFELAARKKLPVVFVYVMKEPKLHYHLYAKPSPEFLTARELLESYANDLEKKTRKYPNQWFNFYDYWNDFPRNQHASA